MKTSFGPQMACKLWRLDSVVINFLGSFVEKCELGNPLLSPRAAFVGLGHWTEQLSAHQSRVKVVSQNRYISKFSEETPMFGWTHSASLSYGCWTSIFLSNIRQSPGVAQLQEVPSLGKRPHGGSVGIPAEFSQCMAFQTRQSIFSHHG